MGSGREILAKDKAKGRVAQSPAAADEAVGKKKLKKQDYEAELERLQLELVKLQEYIKEEGLRVVVLFEDRDAAARAAQ